MNQNNQIPALNSRDILILYLQIINGSLVEDPYKQIIQNTIIKLHVIDGIDKIIISKGLSLIKSNKAKYFKNYCRVYNNIFSPKPNNNNFITNLLFSAIFSGGFTQIHLLYKMSIYLQRCYPKRSFQINQIYNLFCNQCLPLLNTKANDYFKYISYNPSTLPLFSKYFLISFIGYRNFPIGFPYAIQSIFFSYLSGALSFDNAVLILIKNGGNEIQMDAFLSFIRILFPSPKKELNSDEDEFIFSSIFHSPLAENNEYIERINVIIQNCIDFCKEKMKFDLERFTNDFVQFKNENVINLKFDSTQMEQIVFAQDVDSVTNEAKL